MKKATKILAMLAAIMLAIGTAYATGEMTWDTSLFDNFNFNNNQPQFPDFSWGFNGQDTPTLTPPEMGTIDFDSSSAEWEEKFKTFSSGLPQMDANWGDNEAWQSMFDSLKGDFESFGNTPSAQDNDWQKQFESMMESFKKEHAASVEAANDPNMDDFQAKFDSMNKTVEANINKEHDEPSQADWADKYHSFVDKTAGIVSAGNAEKLTRPDSTLEDFTNPYTLGSDLNEAYNRKVAAIAAASKVMKDKIPTKDNMADNELLNSMFQKLGIN